MAYLFKFPKSSLISPGSQLQIKLLGPMLASPPTSVYQLVKLLARALTAATSTG